MTQLPLHDTGTRNNIGLMTKHGIEPKSGRERRAESRHPVSEPGVIKSGFAGIAVAEVVDTSSSGLRVTAPCPLPVEAQIEVLFQDTEEPDSLSEMKNHVVVIPFTYGCGKQLEARVDDSQAPGEASFAVCLDCGARTPMTGAADQSGGGERQRFARRR
jgi:hypothetical protein